MTGLRRRCRIRLLLPLTLRASHVTSPSLSPSRSVLVRFGAFELDLRSGELRKKGIRVPLQEQPFRILARLLACPGDLVTREQLRQELWPADTFVDFERGLNAAIKRLRDALGESAEAPLFIETVPRRGYRFIAPVAQPHSISGPARPRPWWQRHIRRRQAFWLGGIATAVFLLTIVARWQVAGDKSDRVAGGGSAPLRPMVRLTYDKGIAMEPAISPDGSLVAYASDRAGDDNLDIWLQRTAGGDPIRLTRDAADDREPTFSADGSTIAFHSDRGGGGIYVIPSHTGGEETLIAKRGRGPAFSPDGRWLAYEVGPPPHTDFGDGDAFGKTYVIPSHGGLPQQVLPEFGSVTDPVWSPDSKHLLIVGRTPRATDRRELWVAPLDGSTPVRTEGFSDLVGQGFHNPAVWAWRPGNRIVFSAIVGQSLDLWQERIAPSTWRFARSPERLTNGTDSAANHAAVAANGTLAFSSSAINDDIWSLRINRENGLPTGEVERLTEGPLQDWSPTISADGTLLSYISVPSSREGQIKTKNLETGREIVVSPKESSAGLPAISPDGSQVAYQVGWPAPSREIDVTPASAAAPERVSRECGWCMVMEWSRNQRQIFYLDGGDRGRAKMFALDVRSGDKTLLVGDDHYDVVDAGVSPDSRWMAFVVLSDGHARLFNASIGGGTVSNHAQWIPITPGDAWDDKPRWSFSGDILYFVSDRDGFRCLWAQRLDGATKRPLASPFPIYHFHRAGLSMMNTPLADLGLAVARNRIVFTLREARGSIWFTTLRDPR
jgi:eukaryotic-like serine/threonine-protein kinase